MRKFTIPIDARSRYPICPDDGNNLQTSSWFDYTGSELLFDQQPSTGSVMRCKKISVNPTVAQRKLLIEWFSLYRYAYNHCVSYIRNNKLDSFYTLRKLVKSTFPSEICKRIVTCGVPVHTIDNAIKDAISAYKSSFALHKGKKYFRIRYKKEKANQIITLEASVFSKRHNSFSKKLGIINTSDLIKGISHDSKLSLRDGKFTLFVPTDKENKNYEREVECCALDPGIRTFQTGYCSDGKTFEIGKNLTNTINPLINKLSEGKSNYKKRIRDRIAHLIEDLHWKSANILCKRFNKILIGNMSTIGILQGNLTKGTKRIVQAVSHYTFRQRLKAKCEEYNVQFVEVEESYTSKTCGNCGKLNNSLGSSKVFKCSCGFTVDRDVNGARNIMIKQLQ